MGERLFRFYQWNDMHLYDDLVPNRSAGYPGCNEKAAWALDCALGKNGFEPPDFIISVGDIIHGETYDYGDDFRFVDKVLLEQLAMPFLPCVGNHENQQGEGVAISNVPYDLHFGMGWHNYLFTIHGIAFIVVDTSGAHRQPDEITERRNQFIKRAFARVESMPVIVVTHVPLIAMRDEYALRRSFGFSSWKVADEGAIRIVEDYADQVIAILCGHLHLTAAKEQRGIRHIAPSGTAGFPADFATFDVFADHADVVMHGAPEDLVEDRSSGDIHGARRHGFDFIDRDHLNHESYVSGNAVERNLTLRMDGKKRPKGGAPSDLSVFTEERAGIWREASLRRVD